MRPTRDQTLMEMTRLMAKRGTCSRAQVGAVVALDGRILTTGYNGTPATMPHCQHLPHFEPIDKALGNGCKDAVHAEANAIAYAARYGISVAAGELYTTLSPCIACSQLIINAGIFRVVFGTHYRDDTGLLLLREAGIIVHWFDEANQEG